MNRKNSVTLVSEAEKQRLRQLTPLEQFERDILVWERYLLNPITDQLSAIRKAVVKRIFYLCSRVQFEFKKPLPGLNLASILSHGGRITFSIPPLSANHPNPNYLIRWLIGGKQEVLSTLFTPLRRRAGELAAKKNKAIFTRFATHTVNIDATQQVHEIRLLPSIKGLREKLKVWHKIIINGITGKHLGINLGLGDPEQAAPEDGLHGHLYLYWQPPTKEKPGALLIGCEGSETGKLDRYGNKHNHKAVSSEFSATGGLKFRHDVFRAHGFEIDEVDGMRVSLTHEDIYALQHFTDIHIDQAFLRQSVKFKSPLRATSMSYIQEQLQGAKTEKQAIAVEASSIKKAVSSYVSATAVQHTPVPTSLLFANHVPLEESKETPIHVKCL